MAQAEALALHALHIHEQYLGPLHPSTASDLQALAMLYRDQGRLAEAGPLFLRALSIREQAFVSAHLSLAETWYEFALFLHAQGHHDEAHALYERALAARIQILGATHSLIITLRERLMALSQTMSRVEEVTRLDGAQPKSVDLLRGRGLERRNGSTEQSAVVVSARALYFLCALSASRRRRSSKVGKIGRGVSVFAAVRAGCTSPPSQVRGNLTRREKPGL